MKPHETKSSPKTVSPAPFPRAARVPWLLGYACLAMIALAPAGQAEEETKDQRDARMAWFREAKFGMFIHWGVYAVPAGTYHDQRVGGIGEWIMRNAQIPVAEYRGFAKQFNPVKYQPDAWAKVAKEAGMRYIVITSKHHDGFALFPSDVTDWDIQDATPYGKDLIGPLAAAARAEGLKFGLYYSQAQDWTHPGGAKARMTEGQGWDDAHKGSFDEYLQKIAQPQVKEILTRYQPDILWWDTPMWMNPDRAKPLHNLLALRPGIISNNRLGGGFKGDTETPEQHIPATGYADRDWETCMTMNGTWGYKSYDQNWKSTETLIRNLVDIVSKGGNYLLNVGPTAEGEIPAPSIERLHQVGAWMKVNGDAVYGTTASPFKKLAWGRCSKKVTSDGATLYLHVFNWPKDGKLVVPGLKNEVTLAGLLATGTALEAKRDGNNLIITVPAAAPDSISSTVVLKVKGPLDVEQSSVQKQEPNGSIRLASADATLHGSKVKYEDRFENLGYWTDAGDWVEWPFEVTQPGAFKVILELASTGSANFDVAIAGQSLNVKFPDTGDYGTFKTVEAGTLTIGKAGKTALAIKPVKAGWKPVNLKSVKLVPAR